MLFYFVFLRSPWRPIISEGTEPIFTKFSRQAHIWVGVINPTFFRDRSMDVATVNQFLTPSGENRRTPHSLRALAFHIGWEDRNTHERVITADDPSMSSVKIW